MTTPTSRINEWTVTARRIDWHAAEGDRILPLGRNVRHDSRNLWYRYQRTAATLITVLHNRQIPILDQGDVGSCTGNGEIGVLGTSPNFELLPAAHPTLDEAEALFIYSAAEDLDGDGPYPPNDNGSSGPSAAQAAVNAGLISGYVHCLSLADVLDALQQQAVSIGINWYDSFDNPPASGLLTISAGASVRGGHEPMLRGIDVDAQEVFGDNSWGTSWGPLGGSFRMGWATLERLLSEQGDGTVSVPLGDAPPQPTPPVPPSPAPPGPVPDAADTALWTPRVQHWAESEHHVGDNHHTATSLVTWARAKGLI